MFDLTPSERRGALVLLALVALGAAADLVRREPVPAPAPGEDPVPAPAAGPAASGARAGVAPAGALDLNAATAAELERLPGIGPVLAERIVAHRRAHGPFRRTAELLAVRGVGPKLVERLRPLLDVRPARTGRGDTMRFARPDGK